MSDYFEPWWAAPPRPTPEQEEMRKRPCPPDANPEAWSKCNGGKPDHWLIWGENMVAPSQSESFATLDPKTGRAKVIEVPGDRVVLTVRPPTTDQEVTAESLAKRIVACVNAMAGITNPEAWTRRAKRELEKKGVS